MDNSTCSVRALLLGEYSSDRRLIRDVFLKSRWELREPENAGEALEWARQGLGDVIIAESSDWEDLLDVLVQLSQPPALIVTSRTADAELWAAVLNRGGFDVLPQPLDREELQRVVAAASRHALSSRKAEPKAINSAEEPISFDFPAITL